MLILESVCQSDASSLERQDTEAVVLCGSDGTGVVCLRVDEFVEYADGITRYFRVAKPKRIDLAVTGSPVLWGVSGCLSCTSLTSEFGHERKLRAGDFLERDV